MKLTDLTKSNCSWLVFLGFLNLASLQEFLPGGLASHSWSGLLSGQLHPPNVDGLGSAVIWSSCQVGNDCGNLTTSSSCSPPAIHFMDCSGPGGISCPGDEGLCGHLVACTTAQVFNISVPPFSPLFGVTLVLTILKFGQKENQPIRQWNGLMRVMQHAF